MGHQTQTAKAKNRENVKALIEYIQKHDAAKNSIGYVQVRDVVLLGKNHSKSDVALVNPDDRYVGTIRFTIAKKEIAAQIDGNLEQGGDKERQVSGRSELEQAIDDALEATAVSKLQREFKWVK